MVFHCARYLGYECYISSIYGQLLGKINILMLVGGVKWSKDITRNNERKIELHPY